MAILKKEQWEKHSNPWSGWTRTAVYPFIHISIWHHNWFFLGVVVIFIIVNPVLFSKPKNINNWMSKGVLGEQLWAKKFRWDFLQFLNFINSTFLLFIFPIKICFAKHYIQQPFHLL